MYSIKTIKTNIEGMLCPKHDIYPSVHIISNEIEIACCCAAFHETCTSEAKKMLADSELADYFIYG